MRNYFFIIFLFIAGIVNGQSKEYHGTIKRKKGKTPVPGASVILKGTNMGVVTDKNGNFKIVVPDSIRTLIIHAVSFTPTELSVGDQDFLDIYLDSEICYVDWF
ncbi:MAG TPA: carboxypeptidase-like regulatory domain-containing protein, partial [Chitinophagaceae bacterium]|nr:carboxypeptidase-like regulatory domain-containing protein [Chitinophagaceae bacterium]